MKWSNEIEKHFKSLINEAVDQDKDGDNDFDDIKIARMMASGMSKEDALKKVKEEKELDEMNVTGNLDGGEGPPRTPYAFGKEEDEKKSAEKLGMKKVPKTNKYFKPMEGKSTYKRMMSEMYGVVNEVSYRDYKKDPTSTPQQKVNRGINEVNKMLAEMEKIVQNNLRLKTEMGVQSNHFWKSTGKRFAKINERMTRISNRLKELSQ